MANPTISKGFIWTNGATVMPSRLNAEVDAATLQFDGTDQIAGRASAGAGPAEAIACTAAGRALIDDASATAQRATLGLDQVNNTSDAGKPVSTAQQAALDLKANITSPTFLGTPAAPTAATATNNTQLATTAFVQAVVAALINGSPGALDTLKELADALGDDANFAATMTTALAAKLAKSANLSDLTNPAAARVSLGIGSNALGNRTVSASGPSAGADGDIWLQV